MRRLVLSLVAVLAACAPKEQEAAVPMLPTDGTDHVAKPPPPPSHGDDPWVGRNDMIAEPAPKSPPSASGDATSSGARG